MSDKNSKRTSVRMTFGKKLSKDDLEKLKRDTDAVEVRIAAGDHSHHEDHEVAQ